MIGRDMPTTPFVVKREEIPALLSIGDRDRRERPFALHDLLGTATTAGAELAWLEAGPRERIVVEANQARTLLIVMRGRARLAGRSGREVEGGDVVTLPPGEECALTASESHLHVLQVRIAEADPSGDKQEELTLERLLQHNQRRAQQAMGTPFFTLLRIGVVDERQRAIAAEAIRVFSDAFQILLFTRQATCKDEGFSRMFHGHLLEELGHNALLQTGGNRRVSGDPLLHATASWFCQQMLVLDNAGKTVVNLALETGGYHFHTLAKPVFSGEGSSKYFDIHSEADEEHMNLGQDLLQNLHPDTYRRLLEILDDSWDMIETMTTRFADLIEIETKSS